MIPKSNPIAEPSAERNAEFQRASTSARRVMVAQDVLTLLDAGRLHPHHGVFTEQLLHDLMRRREPWRSDRVCYCCAVGAAALSAFRYGVEIDDATLERKREVLERACVQEVFGQEDSHAIECWFEGWGMQTSGPRKRGTPGVRRARRRDNSTHQRMGDNTDRILSELDRELAMMPPPAIHVVLDTWQAGVTEIRKQLRG